MQLPCLFSNKVIGPRSMTSHKNWDAQLGLHSPQREGPPIRGKLASTLLETQDRLRNGDRDDVKLRLSF